jgi:predicted transcriptional regulator
MKTAFEIAMEKAEKLGKPSEEEAKKWKYVPEGEKVATKYLKGECSLIAELGKYDESDKAYVVQGACETLLRNIDLPRDDFAKRATKMAMEGLKMLKGDKVSLENVYSEMRRIFSHYEQQGEQQRGQAREELKRSFMTKIQQTAQQQLGTSVTIDINSVEKLPQFQEEWRKVLIQLDSQYTKLLSEYKKKIANLS